MSRTTTEQPAPSSPAPESIPTQPAYQLDSVVAPGAPSQAIRPGMPEILKYSISAVIIIMGVLASIGIYALKSPPESQTSKELIPMVETINAMPYSGQLDKIISGTVVPYREIKVAAEVNGTVIKKFKEFESGNFVKKGTKLVEIDPADYKIQLETGLAEVEQSQKMLEETVEEISGAKKNIANSQREFNLASTDHQRNMRIQNALSSSELDQSKRALLSAETNLTTRKNSLDMLNAKFARMKATLALSKSQLNRTKLNLEKTVVVAPDDGVIVREMVQEGDFVRAGDQLVMFEDTSRSEVICNLTPTDLAWVRVNSQASTVYPDEETNDSFSAYHIPKTQVSVYDTSEPHIVWDGILERFDGIGRDAATRTIPCRITIRNPVVESKLGKRALVRGMFVKCKIEVQTSTDNANRKFISFPAVALRSGNYVWTVVDHKLKKVNVKVVDYAEQLVDGKAKKIVIAAIEPDSLQSGDVIVASPIPQPNEGIEVMIESEVKQKKKEQKELADAIKANELTEDEVESKK